MSNRPVRAFGLSIAPLRPGWLPICGYVDHSPMLAAETTANDNGRRRFRFVEQIGAAPSKHSARSWGDILCADRDTAEFVRTAVNEKLMREQDEMIARNAFEIFGSTISTVGGEAVLKLAAERLSDGETVSFDFILESPKAERQEGGQKSFSHLCDCVGVRDIGDADVLHGRKASYEVVDGVPVFRKAPAPKAA